MIALLNVFNLCGIILVRVAIAVMKHYDQSKLGRKGKDLFDLLFYIIVHHQQIRLRLADILNTFAEADYEITAAPTRGHNDARRIVAERSREYELVVCSGGD